MSVNFAAYWGHRLLWHTLLLQNGMALSSNGAYIFLYLHLRELGWLGLHPKRVVEKGLLLLLGV